MKIIVTVNNYGKDAVSRYKSWYILADSTMTNTGKPFYIPDFIGEISVSLGVAIRITRLGKHIDTKFASRYFSEYAPALHFWSPELEKKLKTKNLPADASRNFDRSLFVGDFKQITDFKPLDLFKNGECITDFNIHRLLLPIEKVIEDFSVINTLKMGDIILPGLSEGVRIGEGDVLEVSSDGNKEFHVKIK